MLPNHNVINPVNRNYIEVETIIEKTLGQFKNALTSTNIHEKMNHEEYANPNENYQILINILSKAKEIYMPKTTRRYNKRKDKKEKWMTNELLQQINKKNDMYVDWKNKSTTTEMYNNKKINFKTFEKIVNINIAETKRIYVKHPYKTLKMSQIFFFILLEIHNIDYRDLYFHIKSSSLNELFVKQSHIKVS